MELPPAEVLRELNKYIDKVRMLQKDIIKMPVRDVSVRASELNALVDEKGNKEEPAAQLSESIDVL